MSLSLSILRDRVILLNQLKVDIIGMSCNTAHILHPALARISKAEFPSLIQLVTQTVVDKNISKIGLLATPTTIKSNIYQNSLKQIGIVCCTLSLSLQRETDILIRDIISGHLNKQKNKNKLENLGKTLIRKFQVEGIILGCTELPLLFPINRFKIPIFDSLSILADHLTITSLNVKI